MRLSPFLLTFNIRCGTLSMFAAALAISGCARQTTVTAEMVPRSLKAINLEETLSRRDELMMAYSLTSYDVQNKAVAVVNGGWGVASIKKGQVINLQIDSTGTTEQSGYGLAKPISLPLPKNGRVVASLVLIEVDDYEQAKQTLAKIQKIHNTVALPIGLLVTAAEVLTPLKYVSAGLVASGVGLQLVDKLDDDDLLGQSSVELREADVRQKKQRFVRVPAVFSGRHMKDSFDYQLEYDVLLKSAKIRSARQ